MARKQVGDLASPEGLRVPGAVTDLYAPPPRPNIDNNLSNLANALTAFAPALSRFSALSAAKDKKQQSALDQAAAQKFIAGHTNEEYKAAVGDGTIPVYGDPVANGVIEKNYGMVVGKSMVQDAITSGIQSGQINLLDPNTDIDKLLTDHSKAAIEAINAHYPNSKFAATGLTSIVAPLRQSLVLQQQKALTDDNVKQRLGVVQQTFSGIIQNAGREGVQPDGTISADATEKAADNIRKSYQELGQSLAISGKTLPPQWMDQQLITELSNNASTNPEVVYSILTSKRKDENGNPLPALADNPRYAQQVQQIVAATNRAMGKKEDTQVENKLVQNGLDAIKRQDGSIWGMHDYAYTNHYTGEHKVISSSDVKKKVMANYQTWSDQTAAARNENSDVKFERDYNAYSQSNLPNPVWKQTLEGASSVFSSPTALQNPQQRQQAMQAGELWLRLSTRNFNYLQNTINTDKPSKDFYTTYEVARRYMGMNADQALDTAASAVNASENKSDLNVAAHQHQQITDAINSDFTSSVFNPLSWFSSDPSNLGQIQKRVGDVASVLVRVHGMTPENAVKNAEKLVRDRSYTINGHTVMDQGYMPPPEMKKYVGQALDQFAKQNGEYNGITGSSDLSIAPAGESGNFKIVLHDGDGIPKPLYVLKDGHAVPAIITMDDLHQLQTHDHNVTDQKIIDKQSTAVSNAQDDALMRTPANELTPEQQFKRSKLMSSHAKDLYKPLFHLAEPIAPPLEPVPPSPNLHPDALKALFGKVSRWLSGQDPNSPASKRARGELVK